MVTTIQRIEFLRKIHLFRGLKEEDLNAIAGQLDEKNFSPKEVIIRQGEEGDRFFLIYKGAVCVTRKQMGRQRDLAQLVERDHFGADSLVKHTRRNATVTAEQETVLLTLSRDAFHELIKRVHGLRTKFEVSIASHRLAQQKQFSWLEKDEVVYFIGRRHSVRLWKALIGPSLALLLPLITLLLFGLTTSVIPLYISGVLFLLILFWIIWQVIDWGNDYYIVTNQRIIWLEKIVGLYDSRQEAPLNAVLSVNSETDASGRVLGYGDVVVRTFVGKIVFDTVGNPDEVVALVQEYWERTRDVTRRANVDALKVAIRQKLGLVDQQPTSPAPKQTTLPDKKKSLAGVLGGSLFKMRFEEKGSIIYRKHWFVLFEQTWAPGTLLLFSLVVFIYNLIRLRFTFDALEIVLLTAIVGVFLWWLYEYIDWSNDIFQVTADQIVDIDKTPLGRVDKRVAPLDNILNLEARREGFLQVLFNFGNVYITVGGGQMVFENVMNPSAVQQDIDRRRVARRNSQEQERAASERDRLAEFFAMYHTNADELRSEMEAHKQKEQEQPKQEQPKVDPDKTDVQ